MGRGEREASGGGSLPPGFTVLAGSTTEGLGGGPLLVEKADAFSNVFFAALQDSLAEPGLKKSGRLCAITYVQDVLPVAALQRTVMKRVVAKVHRFRAVAKVRADDWTYFEEMPLGELDMGYHFEAVDEDFDEETWARTLVEWVEAPWDLSRPLWRFVTVQALPCGRSAVVFLTDHCVGDGASLTATTTKLLCEGQSGIPASSSLKRRTPPPVGFGDTVRAWWVGGAKPFLEALLPGDPDSLFKLDLTPVTEPMGPFKYRGSDQAQPLQKFKDIKNKVPGTTVNDVMLSVMALAVRSLYAKRDDPMLKTGRDLRASFPFNTRRPGADATSDGLFGNHVAVSTVRFPMHLSRVRTLLAMGEESRILRTSPDMLVRCFIRDKLLPLIPRKDLSPKAAEVVAKFSISISNVFISHTLLTLAGAPVLDFKFLTTVPFGLYAGVTTYGDRVNFNVVIPDAIDAHPNEILPLFAEELDALHKEVTAMPDTDLAALARAARPGFPLAGLALLGLASALVASAVALLLL